MTRINTNVAAINAFNNLSRTNKALGKTLEQLSSGFKINRGGDNPSGLIISEYLRRDISGLNQAISNSTRASNVIMTAEASLAEVNKLLLGMRDLAVEAANSGTLSQEEIEANQIQIDSSVQSINRIGNTTSFGNKTLLNGTLDYQITAASTWLTNTAENVEVVRAFVESGDKTITFLADTATDNSGRAERAYVQMNVGSTSGYTSDQTIAITGNLGSEVLSFAAGTTLVNAAAAINQTTENTGIWAYTAGTSVFMVSKEFGSDAFVYAQDIDGTADYGFAAASGGILRDEGQDIKGTINGQKAQGIGRTLRLSSQYLEVAVTYKDTGMAVAADRWLDPATLNTGSTITVKKGGGAKFQLGKKTNQNEQESFALSRVSSDKLGQGGVGWLADIVSGGKYDLKTNANRAAKIIDEAIKDIATLRGRLGNFQLNVLDTNINSLSIGVENLSAAESNIRNTDFAQATSQLTKQQILVSAGTSVLATANATPQNVLALLG